MDSRVRALQAVYDSTFGSRGDGPREDPSSLAETAQSAAAFMETLAMHAGLVKESPRLADSITFAEVSSLRFIELMAERYAHWLRRAVISG